MTQPGNTLQPTTLYLYDGDGNLISQVNPNNTETDTDYTNYWKVGGGEEIVANKRTSDSTTLSQFTYTFDANRNKISELDQVMDPGEGASNTQLYTWAYDADGRLTDSHSKGRGPKSHFVLVFLALFMAV